MINEIKRRLNAGEVVELECIDREGFIHHDNSLHEESNLKILNQDKLIVDFSGLAYHRIYLKGEISRCLNCINFEELKYFKIKEAKDEVEELIESRSNDSYNNISNETGELIELLGTDTRWTYLFSMIANKLIRLKYCYQVEDSLLDIAGYAKLELQKLREEKGEE